MKKELSLNELQMECLKILKDVHQFCVLNNIKYSVAYGTLIGAIRHNGFIPWDDDVDLVMPRQDYIRFCNTFQSDRYKLSCVENNKEHLLAFARVFDDRETVTEDVIPWCRFDSGVWIDIFPLDGVTDNEDQFKLLHKELKTKWWDTVFARTSLAAIKKENSFMTNMKLFVKKIIFFNDALVSRSLKKLVNNNVARPFGETGHWSQLSCLDGYEWNSIQAFRDVSLHPFEDMEVYVMNGYDEVLRDYYGDYMKLPPIDKRKGHSNGLTKFYWK